MEQRRGIVRLVVPSPDGTRVLARPNGLAGWSLPTIPVTLPFTTWDDDAAARAEAAIGTTVRPVRPLTLDAWVVAVDGRVTAAGNTWISPDEAGRVGGDADLVRAWVETDGTPSG